MSASDALADDTAPPDEQLIRAERRRFLEAEIARYDRLIAETKQQLADFHYLRMVTRRTLDGVNARAALQ